MKTAEIRSQFLNYFKSKGHTIVESSSLVPSNDPTLLFTNAGMVQFKDVFLGKEKRAYLRATTSQKCVRAGGKHNDLENVGFTARHHTFFEMLGNFSFGDYFKKEAIHYAWEFTTQVLKLPKDKLYVSVYEKDDEAAEIWHEQENVPKNRIYRFGEKDNFWSMGDTGPCGPCSELYIDRGKKYGCDKPTCQVGCDCDRYMEFWNLVFMQFNRDVSGKLTPLPKPSVDTGAGLERIAAILQNVDTNYETDAFQSIILKTAELLKKKVLASPKPSSDIFSYRVIADHARATTFLIGDGVLPSNEGRGYVLRRIMRRAIRHGKNLGFNEPFLYKVSKFVIEQMKDAYPNLIAQKELIEKAILAEEEQFFKTLERGLVLLDEESNKLKASSSKTIPGEIAFKLYDTYGFPLDLTKVIAAEKNLSVDEEGFEKAMDRQRAESRKHWKGSGQEATATVYLKIASELQPKGKLPKFVGYDQLTAQGECVAILKPPHSEDSEHIYAVFNPTPFYGESGGQIGDQGRITGNGFSGKVIDVQKPTPELIVAQIKPVQGKLEVGKTYKQETEKEIRQLTMKNHTATHLLQWGLRKTLGNHVKQAGSLVTAELLRFDFTHFQPMTPDEIQQVEDFINQKIWSDDLVEKEEMTKDQATKKGAIAMFGEKYSETVRVISVGDYSIEFCGGTHVDRSSDIHLFKIISETGIAAGTRRIIAYTSKAAFQHLRQSDNTMKEVRDRLRASSVDDVSSKLEKIFNSERDLKKQIENLTTQLARGEVDQLLSQSETFSGIKVITAVCSPDASGIKKLRELTDQIKQKHPNSIVVLGIKDPQEERASLIVALGPHAKGIDSGKLIREIAPLIDGKGGGKPELAQAGGTKPSGLKAAIDRAKKWISENSSQLSSI